MAFVSSVLKENDKSFIHLGLLEELSLQSTTDQTRQERSRFVQELVIASAEHLEHQSMDGETNPLLLSSMLKLLESSPNDILKDEEEDAGSKPAPRQGNGVLRGRARSDAQNAKRRAEANRASIEMKKNGIDDPTTSKR